MSRASETRDRLLDAAADILEVEGLSSLNTNALASRAGVTPPTVYRNFKNKEEVMERLAHRFMLSEQAWLTSTETSSGNMNSLEEVVSVLIERYWDSARRQRGIVALRSAMRVWPNLKEVEEQSLRSSTHIVARVLAPYLEGLTGKRLMHVARHTVEIVCSTIDRCYGLAPGEQEWRIAELKKAIAAYLRDERRQMRAPMV
jgi:AcrR family transcriptional regulator